MTSCTQGSDCPNTEKTCAAHSGVSGDVCQCATNALCGSGFVCNTFDMVCQQQCFHDSDCVNYADARRCDVPSGECVPLTSTTDAG